MVISAGITFILALILLIAICSDRMHTRARHVLATFILMLGLAIGVVLALRATNNSYLRHEYHDHSDHHNEEHGFRPDIYHAGADNDEHYFQEYYSLVIADAAATLAIQLILMFMLYLGTLNEVYFTELVKPVVVDVPPLSSNRY